MALTKVNRGGLNTGISDSSNATFLTVDTSEQAVIKSEGGSNTTSVQQGLAKCWVLDNEGGTALDSFNVGSTTDNGTGDYGHTFTNNLSSDNFSSPAACGQNTSFFVINKARQTSLTRTMNIMHDNSSSDGRQAVVVLGDLA